jgi:hypothetical protein
MWSKEIPACFERSSNCLRTFYSFATGFGLWQDTGELMEA